MAYVIAICNLISLKGSVICQNSCAQVLNNKHYSAFVGNYFQLRIDTDLVQVGIQSRSMATFDVVFFCFVDN